MSSIALNSNGVLVSDTHLGIVTLDFGSLAPGQEVCKTVPSETATECTGPGGTCVCERVEGENTAVVYSAVCEDTLDPACLEPGSDCDDTATVECLREGICRTPGFWGTHARANPDKARSQNITQAVINAGGGSLTVCGECISTTVPINDESSAIEALCVSPSGAIVLQNARQLTAMALNCIISGFGADCSGDSGLSDLFDDCNAACVGAPSDRTNEECRGEIDCFNNGGLIGKGGCQTGTCASGAPCNGDRACADGSACAPLTDTCHDRELCNPDVGLCFQPPGPAGSSNECHDAHANHCAVLPLSCSNDRRGGSGESCCTTHTCP